MGDMSSVIECTNTVVLCLQLAVFIFVLTLCQNMGKPFSLLTFFLANRKNNGTKQSRLSSLTRSVFCTNFRCVSASVCEKVKYQKDTHA